MTSSHRTTSGSSESAGPTDDAGGAGAGAREDARTAAGDGRVDAVQLRVSARQQPKSVGRLWRLLRQSVALTAGAGRRLFAVTVLLQLAGAAVLAAQVLIVRALLDAILLLDDGAGSVGGVLVPVALLALVNALVAVMTAAQANEERLLGELTMRSTWQQLLDVAGAVELRFFESPSFFDRLQRVQTNALSRPFQLTQGVVGTIGGLAAAVGLAWALLVLEPLLVPLLLLAGLPVYFATRRQSQLEFEFIVAQTPRLRLRHYLATVQTGRDEAKEIRAFGLASLLRRRFDDVYRQYVEDLRVHVRRRTRLALVGNLVAASFLALTLFALVGFIGSGRVDLGEAGAAIVAIRLLATQVTRIMRSTQQVFESGLFLDDLNDFVEMRPAVDPAHVGAATPTGFDELQVDRVGFTYPGSDEQVLDDVSMRIRAGEIIALVGENGSGKTTLAKLLAALYDPTAGAVRWDGIDTSTFARAGLRESVAVIFQDFVRYHLTAAENIGVGRAERIADRAAIESAAEHADAASAIERLPGGYDTILSKLFQGGQDLSGGQWQRVALARAFFRDAPFVILDEPTASLDPRAEHRLFRSLRELLAGRTVLFISHRFSTVRTADRIYVLHEGRIVEHGTHAQLMDQDGHYAELFRLQAAAYLSPDSST